jgi:hypothetical protein
MAGALEAAMSVKLQAASQALRTVLNLQLEA